LPTPDPEIATEGIIDLSLFLVHKVTKWTLERADGSRAEYRIPQDVPLPLALGFFDARDCWTKLQLEQAQLVDQVTQAVAELEDAAKRPTARRRAELEEIIETSGTALDGLKADNLPTWEDLLEAVAALMRIRQPDATAIELRDLFGTDVMEYFVEMLAAYLMRERSEAFAAQAGEAPKAEGNRAERRQRSRTAS
jgi:hypothetical protein